MPLLGAANRSAGAVNANDRQTGEQTAYAPLRRYFA